MRFCFLKTMKLEKRELAAHNFKKNLFLKLCAVKHYMQNMSDYFNE